MVAEGRLDRMMMPEPERAEMRRAAAQPREESLRFVNVCGLAVLYLSPNVLRR
jgi:hypothetical protein